MLAFYSSFLIHHGAVVRDRSYSPPTVEGTLCFPGSLWSALARSTDAKLSMTKHQLRNTLPSSAKTITISSFALKSRARNTHQLMARTVDAQPCRCDIPNRHQTLISDVLEPGLWLASHDYKAR
ncbi:uncharacterized protein BKA55DRAFT_102360 [Fusarium redolens]|jgi:hypothetical protein|uniref:Uncharacterized protein n=1 Tax=Fusarium redolens TaxID=48865 RepID=A0A9P9K0K0_FUSRE|nr:uncharacterized protein BKA55DRAFT_102360 [Fusarium redolens]KAH7243703.1 hypothetical protein BKA55DRAFT_102360 [Fusarium redolens]